MDPWPALLLISITFLCELECTEGVKVGLAAGRYSGKRRPDLYRTPHALHSVFGPIGPSLHCGVLVTAQCMHFLVSPAACDNDEGFLLSTLARCTEFFFLFCCLLTGFKISPVRWVSESDSEAGNRCKFLEAEDGGETKGNVNCLLMFEGRERLLLARFTGTNFGPTVLGFSTKQELLLSKIETGLEVLKRCTCLTSDESSLRGILEVVSVEFGSSFI